MKRIVVVGGGVTGLAAAHRVTELAGERGLEVDVRLIEGGSRLGGVIATDRRDGFVLERGPDSIITDKPWGLALAKRLGLDDQIISTNSEYRRSFVVRGGRLYPVPEGFQLLAPSRFGPLAASPIFSPLGKARMALDLMIPPRQDAGDESLGGFVERRLGREALERMAQPMIAGIYGADPMRLSLDATVPRFRDMEREHGSVIRGMWARMRQAKSRTNGASAPNGISGARYGLFVSFRDGLQTLTDALTASLPDASVMLKSPVTAVERGGDGWTITAGSNQINADGLILALPAPHAGRLLEPLDPELAGMLEHIRYGSCATMTLCYRREDVPHALDGFGFVVPEVERMTLLGCTFSHVKYSHRAPEGFALLRAFIGETVLEECGDSSRALNSARTTSQAAADRLAGHLPGNVEMERRVRGDLKRLLGVTAEPQFVLTQRWTRAMPRYEVGHLDRVAEIERRAVDIPGLELAGNAYRGVGVPDSIHSGEQAAEHLLSHLLP